MKAKKETLKCILILDTGKRCNKKATQGNYCDDHRPPPSIDKPGSSGGGYFGGGGFGPSGKRVRVFRAPP